MDSGILIYYAKGHIPKCLHKYDIKNNEIKYKNKNTKKKYL